MNSEQYNEFGQSASGTSSLHPSDAVKLQQAVQEIEKMIQIQSQMEIIKNINSKCFERCIFKPASSPLGNGERQCLAKCMDRFQDGLRVVNQTIMQRHRQEQMAAQDSAGMSFRRYIFINLNNLS
eukprot:sb/3475617/